MSQDTHSTFAFRATTALVALVCALLISAALVTSPASAAFEQVGCFAGSFPGLTQSCKPIDPEKETFGEEVQLGGVDGMAVNSTGAGSVPPGTVYAAGRTGQDNGTRISMYVPSGAGLQFAEGWTLERESPGDHPERCGPLVGTACAPRVAAPANPNAGNVAVDPTTGNVFSRQSANPSAGDYIYEWSPDGSDLISTFGEAAGFGKTIPDTPEKVHNLSGAIGVDPEGRAYIYDEDFPGNHRLMVFEPTDPGHDEYVYAGTSLDVAVARGGYPGRGPVFDAAGNLYMAEREHIDVFDPGHPTDPPLCRFDEPKSGIASITVDPQTGEVFFFSNRKAPGSEFKLIHQLGPCDQQTGEFEEIGSLQVKPERDDLSALAFDPLRPIDPSRAPGVLYGAAPGPEPYTVGTGEPGQSSLGYIFAHARELPPLIEAQSVAHVGSTTAELGALIDPRGSKTHYVFQYLNEAAYLQAGESFAPAAEAPLGGADLPNATGVQSVAVALTALSPDTAYRYRVLAFSHCVVGEPNKECSAAGAAQRFHTFPLEALGLPDGRAYELVSPPRKNGGEVFPASGLESGLCYPNSCQPGLNSARSPMQSDPAGEAITYEGFPFSETGGAVGPNQYISRRGKGGWHTITLSPEQQTDGKGTGEAYRAFDPGLSLGILYQTDPVLSPAAPEGYANLYAQDTADPFALNPLLVQGPPNRPEGGLNLTYVGASADLSRVFFEANDALTGQTPFAPAAVDGGKSENNLYEWADGAQALVNVAPGNAITGPGAAIASPSPDSHPVSEDGSRVFWTDKAGQLYVREDGELSMAIPGPGKFLSASTDGSKVLLTNGRLLNVDEPAVEPTDLTQGQGGFEGIVGQSDDLSRLYFVDTEVLAGAGQNDQGASALAGENNLYGWHQGALSFIATLSNTDSGYFGTNDWSPYPSRRTAQASPSGRYLAFLSHVPLTGYDNTGPCLFELAGGKTPVGFFKDAPCAEVFLYDSAPETLACVSCNPSNASPLGPSRLPLIISSNSSSAVPQPRYLTDQGRLFFDSADSLSPSDTNEGSVPGRAAEDVYEFEPQGLGSCERPDGCLHLISAGHEPLDSNFLAIDSAGDNVFFTTRDQLVLKDRDHAMDLYDARVKGGFPDEAETDPTGCQGEACQPQVTPPAPIVPATSALAGDGNFAEPEPKPCRKSKVRKHGKCVNRHKSNQHHKRHRRANSDRRASQ
jgi:hypothetical protein